MKYVDAMRSKGFGTSEKSSESRDPVRSKGFGTSEEFPSDPAVTKLLQQN